MYPQQNQARAHLQNTQRNKHTIIMSKWRFDVIITLCVCWAYSMGYTVFDVLEPRVYVWGWGGDVFLPDSTDIMCNHIIKKYLIL